MQSSSRSTPILAALLLGGTTHASAAATVTTIVRLDMDETIDGDGVTYIGDSGSPTVPVTVRGDKFGPSSDFFTTPGTMDMDSTGSAVLEPDEVMRVHIGPDYDLEQNDIIETWIKPDGSLFASSGNKFDRRGFDPGVEAAPSNRRSSPSQVSLITRIS